MQKSGNKSQGSPSKLGTEAGVDDDLLSGVVGGAGAPTAAPTAKKPDDHLTALNQALAHPVEPAVVHTPLHTPIPAPAYPGPHPMGDTGIVKPDTSHGPASTHMPVSVTTSFSHDPATSGPNVSTSVSQTTNLGHA